MYKPKVDSLSRIAEASGNARLLAYSDFLTKGWLWHYAKSEAEQAHCLEELNKMAETAPYLDLRGHILFWKRTD